MEEHWTESSGLLSPFRFEMKSTFARDLLDPLSGVREFSVMLDSFR